MVGLSGRVFVRGATSVRVKGEWAIARMDLAAADGGTFGALAVDVQRFRLRTEARQGTLLLIRPLAQSVGGAGAQERRGRWRGRSRPRIGRRAPIRHSHTGLSVESEGRWLAMHAGTIDEWGFSTRLLFDPGASNRGLSVGFAPAWGTTASGVEQLWERGSTDRTPYGAPGTRLDAQFGYGFGVPGSRDALSLTPYAGMSLGDQLARGYRLGSLLATGRSTNVSFEIERRDHGPAPNAYGVTARGTILF